MLRSAIIIETHSITGAVRLWSLNGQIPYNALPVHYLDLLHDRLAVEEDR
jgi:hypothetical protein